MGFLGRWLGELGDPIEYGNRSQQESLKFYPGCENFIKEMRTYTYQPIKPDFIEGECSVVEIDGKKLLDDK